MMNEKDESNVGPEVSTQYFEFGVRVPAIRFLGFEGEWEEKEIGDVLTEKKRSVELNDNTSYQLVTVKRRNEGVVPRAVLKGRDILVKNYFEIKAGDYLISKRQVVHGANGIVPENLDKSVVSNEYLVAIGNENITTKFWTILSKRTEMYKKFYVSSYGVDIEKLVFDVNDWKNRKVVVPKLDEQNTITNYFQQLDTLITQHQQKHEKLLNIKKALLEKIFPKQGETVPEIRFKGFSGEWEDNSLGELCGETYGGGTPNTSVPEYWNGSIPWIQSSDLSENNVEDVNSRKTVTEIGLRKSATKLIPGGSIAIVTRVGVGKIALMQNQYCTSQDFLSLSKLKTDPLYGVYAIWKKLQSEKISVQGTSIKGITKDELLSKKVVLPKDKQEQAKIGTLFKHLDTLLSQHQTQLKKLNNIKQACLEKMFV